MFPWAVVRDLHHGFGLLQRMSSSSSRVRGQMRIFLAGARQDTRTGSPFEATAYGRFTGRCEALRIGRERCPVGERLIDTPQQRAVHECAFSDKRALKGALERALKGALGHWLPGRPV